MTFLSEASCCLRHNRIIPFSSTHWGIQLINETLVSDQFCVLADPRYQYQVCNWISAGYTLDFLESSTECLQGQFNLYKTGPLQGLLFLYPVKPISRGRKWQQERRNCCSIPYEISPFLKFRFIQSVPGSLWVLPPVLPFRVHSHSALILNYTLENRQCPGSKKENCWVVVPEMCPPPPPERTADIICISRLIWLS